MLLLDTVVETPEENVTVTKTKRKVKIKEDPVVEPSELTEEEAEIMAEAEQDDEWIEDAEGNFIKKEG